MDKPIQSRKNKLRGERRRRGWSRKYVAEQLEVSEYTVGQWERGKHMPYPVHIQKLCNLFEISAEALGLAEIPTEVNPLEVNHDQADAITAIPRSKRRHLLFYTVVIALVLILATGVIAYMIRPIFPVHIKPGGAWISPTGSTAGDVIHFAAYAYPTYKSDPQIDHLNFTIYWQGVDPRAWKVVCEVRVSINEDVFACDVNLRLLGATPGQITISFDVYDRQGNVNLAPNGEHHLVYVPS